MSRLGVMHIAILSTNTDVSAFAAAHPTDADRFTVMFGLVRPGWRFTSFDVVAGHYPPVLAAFDGYVITGSLASANDPDPWVARLKDFVRAAHQARVPQFGACFGHQVIASALGGRVAHNPGGWRLGAYDGPLGLPEGDQPIRLYAAHQEQVTDLPPGAVLLGGSAECPIGAYRLDGHVFATQYHPEFPERFVVDLIADCDGHMPAPVIDRARASLDAGPAEMARFAESVAQFFEAARD
jgi:GMP synthase-like glutamine amidotransferase